MKKHFKQILSLFLCALVIMGTFTMSKRPEAEAAGSDYNTSRTLTSTSPDGRAQANILHMDRTVQVNENGGFDVTLTSYLDDLGSESSPIDIVFVLDASSSMLDGTVDHKDEVVDSVTTIVKKLQGDGGAHRVGYVTFGGALISNATTNKLLDIKELQVYEKGRLVVDSLSNFAFMPLMCVYTKFE